MVHSSLCPGGRLTTGQSVSSVAFGHVRTSPVPRQHVEYRTNSLPSILPAPFPLQLLRSARTHPAAAVQRAFRDQMSHELDPPLRCTPTLPTTTGLRAYTSLILSIGRQAAQKLGPFMSCSHRHLAMRNIEKGACYAGSAHPRTRV